MHKLQEQQQRLGWVLLLLLALLGGEVGLGVASRSLALLADAEHLFSDLGALGLTLFAGWLAQQPAGGRSTFGWRRIEVLAALGNGLALMGVAVWIAVEGITRLQAPTPVLSTPMLLGALLGLLVNSINLGLLHRHSQENLNLQGMVLHISMDVMSSLGTLLAAAGMHFWGWAWADPLASLGVACLTGWSARSLIQQGFDILMERAPSSLNLNEVIATLEGFPGVDQVETCHLWSITSDQVILCADLIVTVTGGQERDRLLRQLHAALDANFDIQQATLQLRGQAIQGLPPLHPDFQQNLWSMLAGKH